MAFKNILNKSNNPWNDFMSALKRAEFLLSTLYICGFLFHAFILFAIKCVSNNKLIQLNKSRDYFYSRIFFKFRIQPHVKMFGEKILI